jgi:hypothetical protein
MQSNAVQRVTENKKLADVREIKWFDPEMVASTKERPRPRIPNPKGKLTPQVFDASGAPKGICMQNQHRVWNGPADFSSASLDLGD